MMAYLSTNTNRSLVVGNICGFLMFCDGAPCSCSRFRS